VGLEGCRTGAYIFKTIPRRISASCRSFASIRGRFPPHGLVQQRPQDQRTHRADLLLNGQIREAVNTLGPGDIGGRQLKDTHTGNTLCHREKSRTLPKVVYPKPNITRAGRKVEGRGDKIASGSPRCTMKIPRSFISWMPNCTRPSSPLRVNCTWKLSPTFAPPAQRPCGTGRATGALSRNHQGQGRLEYRHKSRPRFRTIREVWMRIEPKRVIGAEFTNSLVGQNVTYVCRPSRRASTRPAPRALSPAAASRL